MANVINRTTKQYLRSVNTPDYSPAEWIINPDMSAVQGWSMKYWKIVGDTVELMSQAERDAVDAQELSDERDLLAERLENVEDILRHIVVLTVDELNDLRQWIEGFKAAVDTSSNLTQLKAAVALLPDMPDRTFAQVKQQLRNALGT